MTTTVSFAPNSIYANNGSETWDGAAWRTANTADLFRLSDMSNLIAVMRQAVNPSTYGYLWLGYPTTTCPTGFAWDDLTATASFFQLSTGKAATLYATVVGQDSVRAYAKMYPVSGGVNIYHIGAHPGTGSHDLRTFCQSNMRFLIEASDGLHGSASGAGQPIVSWYYAKLQVTQYARPTLTVTAPSPIAGATVTTTLRPTITWNFTGDTLGQTGYRVRIFPSGSANADQYGHGSFNPETSTPVYDSNEVSSTATSHSLTTNLTNGTTYRAYVTAYQYLPVSGFHHWTTDGTTLAALGSTQYSQFTINLAAPPVPTVLTPAASATVTTDVPTLGMTLGASTVTGATVRGEWLLATDSGFTANLRTVTEPAGESRTSGATTEAVTAGASELFQTTWFMKGRELDSNGLYGTYSASQSFTVAHAPSANPTAPVGQATVPYNATIGFTWTFSDPSPTDSQTAYQVIVERDSDGLQLWDSGKVTSTIPSATWTGITAPYKDVLLRWRVRVYDSDDVVSAYSANQQFYARDAPVVAITYPTAVGGILSPQPTVTWTFTASGGRTQSQYNVLITSGGTTVYDSGWVLSSATSHDIGTPILAYGVSYITTVSVRDSVGLSGSTSVTATASWTPPDNPTLTVDVTPYDTSGYIGLSWPQNRDAQFINYQIWRRPTGTTAWTLVATVTSTSPTTYSFQDYYAPNTPLDYAVTQTAIRYGVNVASVQSVVTAVPNGSHYWLICYDNTALSVKLGQVVDDGWSDQWEQQEIQLIGRGRRVERGTHFGKAGSLTAKVRDVTGMTARQVRLNLEAMKAAGTLCYLRTPFGDVFKVVTGEMGIARESGVGTNEYFQLTLPYMEVS